MESGTTTSTMFLLDILLNKSNLYNSMIFSKSKGMSEISYTREELLSMSIRDIMEFCNERNQVRYVLEQKMMRNPQSRTYPEHINNLR